MGAGVRFEGISNELQTILNANMDLVSARRRARDAFKDFQLNVGHILFETPFDGLKMKESYEVNSRGLEIFSKSWLPKTCQPKAVELRGSWHYLDMESLQWITQDLVFQKVFMAISQALTGLLMMLLSIIPKLKTAYNVIAYKDKPRLQTALEMLRTTQDIECQLEKVSLPLLILHGEDDIVTDPSVSKALYEKASSKDKNFILYKDSYHSLLEGEPDDMIIRVFSDIISWLDDHSTKSTAG